jgi:hypothetical protein
MVFIIKVISNELLIIKACYNFLPMLTNIMRWLLICNKTTVLIHVTCV